MNRKELQELYYICPIANILSILTQGILSNKRANKIQHESCASEEVQKLREQVVIPGGRPLHNYVNLYFNARNPMMYYLKDGHRGMIVLSISPDVLDIPGTIISDSNASREFTRFQPAPEGLSMIDEEAIYAEYWTHPQDSIEEYKHKGAMCSEVLVPDKVDAKYIMQTYVSCEQSHESIVAVLKSASTAIKVTTNGHLFFL